MYSLDLPRLLELSKFIGSCLELFDSSLMLMVVLEAVLDMLHVMVSSEVVGGCLLESLSLFGH